jgi:hypothetical protein
MDPWSKRIQQHYVLSQLELRLLISLVVHNRRVLKSCHVKQAFIQSSLPPDEGYCLHPPPDCPMLNPGQYWHLLCSL